MRDMEARRLHKQEEAIARPRLAQVPPRPTPAYVHRSFGGKEDFEIFDFALENKLNVLLEGPTGPGKTTAIVAWSADRTKPMATIPSNVGVEPTQLLGKYVPDGKGGWLWMDGPVTDVVRHGGTLLINEVTFMPERVSTAIFGLLDGRREIVLLDHEGETIKAHDDLIVFADMNPHYSGTRELNAAFRNRFNVQLSWDYDRDVEAQLILSGPLLDFMWRLRSDVASEVYSTPVSTNMGMEFERITKGLGYDFAVINFINHFRSEERGSIARLFEAERDTIEPTVPTRELTDEELLAKRLALKIGDRDEEFGIYGIEWVWDEDEESEEDDKDDDLVEIQTV